MLLGASLALPTASLLSRPAAADANVFSEGWRMGMLSKFSAKGIFKKTGEGELLLGNESSPLVHVEGQGEGSRTVQDNPWAFSCDVETYQRLRPLIGEYVAVQYRQMHLTGPLSGDTDYRIVDMKAVDPELAPRQAVLRTGDHGGRSDGDRPGRIVKATVKGNLSKTWELQMQVGNAGTQFIAMSVTDEAMFNAAVAFLRSGRRVKVTYTQSVFFNPLNRDTNYEVLGISLSGGGLTQ